MNICPGCRSVSLRVASCRFVSLRVALCRFVSLRACRLVKISRLSTANGAVAAPVCCVMHIYMLWSQNMISDGGKLGRHAISAIGSQLFADLR